MLKMDQELIDVADSSEPILVSEILNSHTHTHTHTHTRSQTHTSKEG